MVKTLALFDRQNPGPFPNVLSPEPGSESSQAMLRAELVQTYAPSCRCTSRIYVSSADHAWPGTNVVEPQWLLKARRAVRHAAETAEQSPLYI